MDECIRECNPTICIELGCYFGYSALRIARLLKSGAKLITIEADPDYAEISRKILEYAGMTDKVCICNHIYNTMVHRTSSNVVSSLNSLFFR